MRLDYDRRWFWGSQSETDRNCQNKSLTASTTFNYTKHRESASVENFPAQHSPIVITKLRDSESIQQRNRVLNTMDEEKDGKASATERLLFETIRCAIKTI
jgi:hypothetical protein